MQNGTHSVAIARQLNNGMNSVLRTRREIRRGEGDSLKIRPMGPQWFCLACGMIYNWLNQLHCPRRSRPVLLEPFMINPTQPNQELEKQIQDRTAELSRAEETYAHVLDRAYVLTNAAGRPLRMIGSMKDITERKQAEEKLQEYMVRLKGLSSRLLEAQEIERRWLARELHDEIGQLVTAL